MLKLIVGLGNPGRQYQRTRHNAGFWFLEGLVVNIGAAWLLDSRFQGLLASMVVEGQKVWLLKPETFMNRSGQAVGRLARYYKIQPHEILVVHDELDFEPGQIRLKQGGGHAGHNGLKDIVAHLGTKDFCRLRIGIGRSFGGLAVADYVLSDAAKSEREMIFTAMNAIYDFVDLLVTEQYDRFMSQLH